MCYPAELGSNSFPTAGASCYTVVNNDYTLGYNMYDINRMFQQELSFCEAFTTKKITDFGVIYYNPDNPRSHDSNRAHIMRNLENPLPAIREIMRFYKVQNLSPRLYPSFIEGELEILRPYLEDEGFTIDSYDDSRTYLYPAGILPSLDQSADIRRITAVTDDVVDLIHTDEDGDWTIKVLRIHLGDDRFHLLGIYDSGKCVAIASVNTLDGYSRIDNVLTHTGYRRRHFAEKLISYLVDYHSRVSDNLLYLWAVNPAAYGLYEKVGFKEIPVNWQHWTAYLR